MTAADLGPFGSRMAWVGSGWPCSCCSGWAPPVLKVTLLLYPPSGSGCSCSSCVSVSSLSLLLLLPPRSRKTRPLRPSLRLASGLQGNSGVVVLLHVKNDA